MAIYGKSAVLCTVYFVRKVLYFTADVASNIRLFVAAGRGSYPLPPNMRGTNHTA
jgi:hypothetical protein